MQNSVKTFLRNVAVPATVNVVAQAKATQCQLRVTGRDSHVPICITVTYSAPRHGCGMELDGFWARTNDADRFAGSHGNSLEAFKLTASDLIEAICQHLEKQLSGELRLAVQVLPTSLRGGEQLPNLEGDSDSGRLQEQMERSGL